MYTSLVQALILILLVFLSIVFYLWKKELQRFKQIKSKTLFLNHKESLKMVAEKAKLSPDERDNLDKLYELAGVNNLHNSFNDKEIARTWLTRVQRALVHDKKLDHEERQELELSTYEIFYKVCLSHDAKSPIMNSLKDLTDRQRFAIQLPDYKQEIAAELDKKQLTSFSLKIFSKEEFQEIYKHTKKSRRITASFWKKLDAGYSFYTNVLKFSTQSSENIIILEYPKKLERTGIRRFPRKSCEIPSKFQLAIKTTDPDTGGMTENIGAFNMGLINNMGGNGCSIVSSIPAETGSSIHVHLTLFKYKLSISGFVKQTSEHNGLYILSVQFHDDLSRQTLLYIYRFLFADPDTVE